MFRFNYETLTSEIKNKGWNDDHVVGMSHTGFISIKPQTQWQGHDVKGYPSHFRRVLSEYTSRRNQLTQTTHFAQTNIKSLPGAPLTVGLTRKILAALDNKTHKNTPALITFHQMEQSVTNAICNPDFSQQRTTELFQKNLAYIQHCMTREGYQGVQRAMSTCDYLDGLETHYRDMSKKDKFSDRNGEKRKKKCDAVLFELTKAKKSNRETADRWLGKIATLPKETAVAWHQKQPETVTGKPPAKLPDYMSGAEEDDPSVNPEGQAGGAAALTVAMSQVTVSPVQAESKSESRIGHKIKQSLSQDLHYILENPNIQRLIQLLSDSDYKYTDFLPYQLQAAAYYLGAKSGYSIVYLTADQIARFINLHIFNNGPVIELVTDEHPANEKIEALARVLLRTSQNPPAKGRREKRVSQQ